MPVPNKMLTNWRVMSTENGGKKIKTLPLNENYYRYQYSFYCYS